uniref:Uncharacterized protein n=1 Tax=Trichuris muris TaxID=70415 RepID=A0A5S6R0R3_TRIMR
MRAEDDELREEVKKVRECLSALTKRLEMAKENGERKLNILLQAVEEEKQCQVATAETIIASEKFFEERRRKMKEMIVTMQDRLQVVFLSYLRVVNNKRTLLDLKLQEFSEIAQELSKIWKQDNEALQSLSSSGDPTSFVQGVTSSLPEPVRSAVVEYMYKRASSDEELF